MKILYPSLLQWCADTAAIAIRQWGCQDTSIQMPSFKLEGPQRGLVTSPLPLWFAAQQNITPEQAGVLFLQQFQEGGKDAPQGWLHTNHWLYLQFSDDALVSWLQRCLVEELRVIGSDRISQSDSLPMLISENPAIFALQYAHARCCSLLQLICENLSIQNPIHINLPWLTERSLAYLHPSAQTLLQLLLQFPQGVLGQKMIQGMPYSNTPGYQSICNEKIQPSQLQSLGSAFFDFHRDCRILDASSTQNSEPTLQRTQLRWALVQIVQRQLQCSLYHFLGSYAPTNL
jgi:hypothetical protein